MNEYGTASPSRNDTTPAATRTNAGAPNGSRLRASSGSVISSTIATRSQSDPSTLSTSPRVVTTSIVPPIAPSTIRASKR